ncbi:MAG: sialate O-acetylesterase [Ruminococcaceae bacterium]|nr:sialate O-acetylesterase [Oscillospiraceae bacterium]
MAVKNYQILQRNEKNFAKAVFTGKVPANITPEQKVYGRVVGENDYLVIVQWTEAHISGEDWTLEIEVPAGGLYRFEAVAANSDMPVWNSIDAEKINIVKHFGVGDVYIMAGQSNMSGYGRDFAIDPPTLGVHLYANSGVWDIATHPLNDGLNTIYPENYEGANGTCPGLSFARVLKERLNVPIGLVAAALGGSPLRAWNIEEDGYLYKAMMRRINDIGTSVKGIIWYQGCSDANPDEAGTYYDRFVRFAETARKDLGDIDIITVQLNHWNSGRNPEMDRCWGIVRDAQRRLAQDFDYIHIIPAMGLSMSDGIHNNSESNVIIGSRMAMVTLKEVYGLPGLSAPDILEVKQVEDNVLILKVDPSFCMIDMDCCAEGMHVEDAEGLVEGKRLTHIEGGMRLELPRAITLPAKFHAYWRNESSNWMAKDRNGMPLLSCYNVDITK